MHFGAEHFHQIHHAVRFIADHRHTVIHHAYHHVYRPVLHRLIHR